MAAEATDATTVSINMKTRTKYYTHNSATFTILLSSTKYLLWVATRLRLTLETPTTFLGQRARSFPFPPPPCASVEPDVGRSLKTRTASISQEFAALSFKCQECQHRWGRWTKVELFWSDESLYVRLRLCAWYSNVVEYPYWSPLIYIRYDYSLNPFLPLRYILAWHRMLSNYFVVGFYLSFIPLFSNKLFRYTVESELNCKVDPLFSFLRAVRALRMR